MSKVIVLRPATPTGLSPDGRQLMTVQEIKPESEQPLYQQFNEIIGGYLENVSAPMLPKPYIMICDKEGIIKNLKLNVPATLFYSSTSPIVGNVIICKMVQTPEGPDWAGLTEYEVDKMLYLIEEMLKAAFVVSMLKGAK